MCPACGAKKSGPALLKRTYTCVCSHVLDRDADAALNIKKKLWSC
ncbi:MAG: transposase [Clostridiales bacterium]|nr:transposase [Clostridiales bacterium]